jgi:hypothetical protein
MKKIIVALVTCMLLLACSSNPYEEYKDYYYEYKNNDQLRQFTYVLYLGEEGDHLKEQNKLESITPERQRQDTDKSGRRQGKARDDDFISLSFRMEEEAFKRLELRFNSNDFCTEEPTIENHKYSWLKYTIKGYCKT